MWCCPSGRQSCALVVTLPFFFLLFSSFFLLPFRQLIGALPPCDGPASAGFLETSLATPEHWQPIESALDALRGSADTNRIDEAEHTPKLFAMLSFLPQHPRTLRTALQVRGLCVACTWPVRGPCLCMYVCCTCAVFYDCDCGYGCGCGCGRAVSVRAVGRNVMAWGAAGVLRLCLCRRSGRGAVCRVCRVPCLLWP